VEAVAEAGEDRIAAVVEAPKVEAAAHTVVVAEVGVVAHTEAAAVAAAARVNKVVLFCQSGNDVAGTLRARAGRFCVVAAWPGQVTTLLTLVQRSSESHLGRW
jgi:hypothetical protein